MILRVQLKERIKFFKDLDGIGWAWTIALGFVALAGFNSMFWIMENMIR